MGIMGKKDLRAYKGLYPKSDVYILGTSRKLLDSDVAYLKSRICIGANSSYLYKGDCHFFIAGHLIWALLYYQFAQPKHTCIYHGEPKTLSIPKITTIADRQPVEKGTMKYLGQDHLILGNEMIAFSATHLAVLLGAKRIIYIGFESKEHFHFTQYEPYHSTFYEHLTKTIKRFPQQEYFAKQIIRSHYPKEDIRTTAKMRASYMKHLGKYQILFDRLKELNIKPYTMTENSIIYEAGGALWSQHS